MILQYYILQHLLLQAELFPNFEDGKVYGKNKIGPYNFDIKKLTFISCISFIIFIIILELKSNAVNLFLA
jgi:hypothetical protein